MRMKGLIGLSDKYMHVYVDDDGYVYVDDDGYVC